MKAKRLTVPGIAKYRPPVRGRVEHFDALAPGLALRITSTGSRSWTLLYRFKGELRRDWLGDPAIMSLEAAREEAKRSRAEAKSGIDPQERRRREKSEAQRVRADTFRALSDEYMTRHAMPNN